LKTNPRSIFDNAIQKNDIAQCLIKTAEMHGHYCPGSALGVMASLYGLSKLKSGSSDGMEKLMAIVENNSCFVDGVQAVSGCTLGNNSLVYRDLGKNAVTFTNRGKKEGVRIIVRNDFRHVLNKLVPDFYPLMEKVIRDRNGSKEDAAKFKAKALEASFAMINVPFEELFKFEIVDPLLPSFAPITENVICEKCGEMIMSTKASTGKDNEVLCRSCARSSYYEVEGAGIVAKP
jgi:formylmethanofuran dehydrogenase subunit E